MKRKKTYSIGLVDVHSSFVFVVVFLLFWLFLCTLVSGNRILIAGPSLRSWCVRSLVCLGLINICRCFFIWINFSILIVICFLIVDIDLALLDDVLDAGAVLLVVLAVHDCGCVVGRRIHIWVSQQRLNRCQNAAHIVHGWPCMLQYIKANAAIGVNVRVKHLGKELNLRGLVWVVLCKLNRQVKAPTVPNRVFWTEDDSLPVVERIAWGCSLDALLGGILMHFL